LSNFLGLTIEQQYALSSLQLTTGAILP